MNSVHYYMIQGGDFLKAGRISSSVKSFLREHNYKPEIIQRALKITYEAEINVASYADYGYFLIYFLNNSIKFIVKDKGYGIEDIELAMQPGYSTASDEIRKLGFGSGMGLHNIKTNSDSFVITSITGKGTQLEISIYLNSGVGGKRMTFKGVMDKTGYELITQGIDTEREIRGGYAGDLLSDVNANAQPGNIWVTVLTHPNVAAVAGLKDMAGIIVCGGMRPGKEFIERAVQENIPAMYSDSSTYEVVSILSAMGITANP